VLFHEGPSDEEFLRLVAERYGRPLPRNIVFWQFGKKHPERKVLFDFLSLQVPQLKGLSLLDRDSGELAVVDSTLIPRGVNNYGELRPRTWRRRQIENYLLIPAAIARASNADVDDVVSFLQTEWGLACGNEVNLIASGCNAGLRDARGKEILYEGIRARGNEAAKEPVQRRFRCTRHEIARSLNPDEIAEDLRRLIDEIHEMCSNPTPQQGNGRS
jgi:hypothetical protein